MLHKKPEDLLQVTRASYINLALIGPDRKLLISSFINLLNMINHR